MFDTTTRRLTQRFFTCLGILALAIPSGISAQSFGPAPVDGTEVRLELERPFLEGNFGFLSTVWDVDVAIPLSEGRSLVVGVPLAIGTIEDVDASATFGNLRATLLFGTPENARGFLGVVLPTSFDLTEDDYAAVVGLAGRLDGFEEWIDDAVALRAGLIRSGAAGPGEIGLRLGGAVVTTTEFEETDVWARGGIWARTRTGAVALHGQLSGAWLATEDGGFGANSVFYLDAGVDFEEVSGRPGIFLRIPLDDSARGPIDASLGVRIVL